MKLEIYLLCLSAGILGLLFHLFVLKLPTLKKRCEAAKIEFSLVNYLKEDWLALVASVLSILIFIFMLDELAKIKPWVMDYIKFFFVFIGYTGSSILQNLLGKTEKSVNKMINDKTNAE